MSVLIAVPCYGSVMHYQTALSLVHIRDVLARERIVSDLLIVQGESAITRGRSNIVAFIFRASSPMRIWKRAVWCF